MKTKLYTCLGGDWRYDSTSCDTCRKAYQVAAIVAWLVQLS